MTDYVEEELERLSEVPKPAALSVESFRQPIEKLFSKAAICVDVDQTVGDALALMREHAFGAVVVTRKGELAGIITERDLVTKVIGVVDDFKSKKVTEVMTPDPISLRKEDPIVYVMHNMQLGGYRHVPIVDADDRPVSVVSIKDVVRFVLGHFTKEIYNLPPQPYRGARTREGA
jgi:CBS domain-containing protein